MPGWTVASLNLMLDAPTVNLMSLHNGDPGVAGEDNEIDGGGYGRLAGVFNAAADGDRLLNADVEFSGPPGDPVTHIGFWEAGEPDVFRASKVATGDLAFNSEGKITVKATTTKLTIDNLA